jgi:hypothetical protein
VIPSCHELRWRSRAHSVARQRPTTLVGLRTEDDALPSVLLLVRYEVELIASAKVDVSPLCERVNEL